MIRPESFQLALALGTPFLLWSAIRIRSWIIPAALTASTLLASETISLDANRYETDPGWRDFRLFNEARSTYHDGPFRGDFVGLEPFLPELGWSSNDLAMFDSWYFADSTIFSLSSLEHLSERLGSRKPKVGMGIGGLIWVLSQQMHLVLICLAGLWLSVRFTTGKRRTTVLMGLGQGLLVGGVLLYLAVWKKVPDRVVTPTIMAATLLMLHLARTTAVGSLHLGWRKRWLRPVAPTVTILAIVAWGVAVQVRTLQSLHTENRFRNLAFREFSEGIDGLASSLELDEIILFDWGGGIPGQFQSPLSAGDPFSRVRVIALGWETFTPIYFQVLDRVSIEDPTESLYGREDVFIVPRPGHSTGDLPTLKTFISEHKAERVQFWPVLDFHFPQVDPEFRHIPVFRGERSSK